MKLDLNEQVEMPEGVSAAVAEGIVTVKGPQGEVKKTMNHPRITITVEGNVVKIDSPQSSKREKKQVFTYRAHLRNMVKGVQDPYVYKVKICSGHFPMNVSHSGKEFSVKNFLGEKVPRTITIMDGADVKVEGDMITITSCDKEIAGQVAADMEQLTRVTNRDRRIFQDGLYIVEKAGAAQ